MPSNEEDPGLPSRVSRRSFLHGAAVSAVTLPVVAEGGTDLRNEAMDRNVEQSGRAVVRLHINGQSHTISVDPRTTLLDALRDQVGLTGTKKGCGHGQCGACTVHANGERILSCMLFAWMAEGREITTIEGLAPPGGELHPMQQAFVDQDAFQCGYCTPGQIMSAIACVHEGHAETELDVREYMSGNICRCAAYTNIVAAVMQAKAGMRKV